jgi:hypothetical protein
VIFGLNLLFNLALLPAADFITTSTTLVGPGVVHKKIIEPHEPWTINVLEVDLSNPLIRMESVKAGDYLGGQNPVSAQAANHGYPGHVAVGATNGDYWSGTTGYPINAQVVEGEMVKLETVTPSNPIYWPAVGFNAQNQPSITVNSYTGMVLTQLGSLNITEVNYSRSSNALILYNRFMGNSTGTNSSGTEILIAPIEEWAVNDTVDCIVEQIAQNSGNMTIPDGKAVLSASGSSATQIYSLLAVGDTVRIFLGLSPSIRPLKYLVGGFPTIVKDGTNYAVQGYYEEGGASTFHTDLHPRTGVGFSADSSKLFMITVDGRQEISRGMNLIELADFMVGLGVYKGMNLDGGGSTTMVVRGAVQNSPSDGSERYVRNALVAFSTAPEGELAHIQIIPDYCYLFTGQTQQLSVSGWDEYYNPVTISSAELEFTIDPELGNIDNQRRYTATGVADSGMIYVKYQSFTDSARVYLKGLVEFAISPQQCLVDTIAPMQFSVKAVDEDGYKQSIPAQQIQWQNLNPEIGTIDTEGLFRGVQEGQTRIVANFFGYSDTAEVTVAILSGTVSLDEFEVLGSWSVEGVNCDSNVTRLSLAQNPDASEDWMLRLDYQFINLVRPPSLVYLHSEIFTGLMPESFELDYKSDGLEHSLWFLLNDVNEEEFSAEVAAGTDTSAFQTLSVATGAFSPTNVGAVLVPPVYFKGIKILLKPSTGRGELNQGILYFDKLRAIYPSSMIDFNSGTRTQPRGYQLDQNYPNPFNPVTVIRYFLPEAQNVRLVILDLRGQEVARLAEGFKPAGEYLYEFDGSTLSSGIYLYRLEMAQRMLTRKMLLVK